MIPVASLCSLPGFEPATLVVERYAAPGVGYRGNPVEATPTLLELQMVTHQATRRQLRRAALDAADDWRAFYCNSELRTAGSGTRPDVVRFGSQRFELQNVADYNTIGGIWLALGKRIE